MPDPNATPQVAAPAPAGQPAPPAVQPEPVQATLPLETQVAPAAEPAATAPDLTQELETIKKRYADSSAEALRLYRENEALKAPKPAPAQPQTYSPEQLETWKEQWLVEASTKPEKAADAAHQVRLIDAELRKADLTRFAGQHSATQAYEKLRVEVDPILKQYQDEIKPGSPIYNDAQALHSQAVAAGMPDNTMTATAAVLLALAKGGKFGVQASQSATKNLNQAIKSAAAAGSGAANQNAAPGPDFSKFDPKTPAGRQAFADYRKSMGVGK